MVSAISKQPVGLQLLAQQVHQAERHVGVLAGVRPHVLDGHVAHRDRHLARADEVGDGLRAVVEVEARHVVELVAGLGLDQVVRHHRVEKRPGHVDAVALEHHEVVLDVVADFERRRAQQRLASRVQHGLLGRAVGQRRGRVNGFFGAVRGAHPHEARRHRVGARGLGVEGEALAVRDHGRQLRQVGLGVDGLVVDGVLVHRRHGLVRAEVEREVGVVLGKMRRVAFLLLAALGVGLGARAEPPAEAELVEDLV